MSAYTDKKKKRRVDKLLRIYGSICVYCGNSLSKKEITIDHVQPKSKGGTGKISNLVIACKKCNASKADRFDKPKYLSYNYC